MKVAARLTAIVAAGLLAGSAVVAAPPAAPAASAASVTAVWMNINRYCARQYGAGSYAKLLWHDIYGWKCYVPKASYPYQEVNYTQLCVWQWNTTKWWYQSIDNPYSLYCYWSN